MRRRQRGQASVELALALPLVALILLAVVQIALVLHAQLLVTHAAREAARAASVSDQPTRAARDAALGAGPFAPDRLDVTSSPAGANIRVSVFYRFPLNVPLVSRLFPSISLSDYCEMAREN